MWWMCHLQTVSTQSLAISRFRAHFGGNAHLQKDVATRKNGGCLARTESEEIIYASMLVNEVHVTHMSRHLYNLSRLSQQSASMRYWRRRSRFDCGRQMSVWTGSLWIILAQRQHPQQPTYQMVGTCLAFCLRYDQRWWLECVTFHLSLSLECVTFHSFWSRAWLIHTSVLQIGNWNSSSWRLPQLVWRLLYALLLLY